MKKPTLKQNSSSVLIPAPAQEIAQEFARIANLAEGGKRSEAWSAANALYAKYPMDPTANFIIALILKENGQDGDALPFAEAAVKFAPADARNLVFLGKLYVDLKMVEFAPDVLHKAFALDKSLFQAPRALAHYYLESGQGSRALPYFELALEASSPRFESEIRLERANCFVDLGRIADAEADYRRVMIDPKFRVKALARITLLQKSNHTSDYAIEVRKELERHDLTSEERSWLLLCLGRLHENGGDYDKAFLNFEGSRKLLVSRFNTGDFLMLIDDAVKVLTRDVFVRFRQFGHESEKPVFVVGMPRSGTTLTEQIIAAHSQAEGVGELERMISMARHFFGREGMRPVLDKMTEVGPERWKDIPQKYLNLLDALAPDAHRTVDKLPHNFLFLGFIHLCFPNAKIIHCKRNPLDNFISAFQNDMSAHHGYSYEQVAYGEYYINYLRLMDHWKAVMPNSIYEIQYEKLAVNPEIEVRMMLNFLGLPWEESCLNFNERESTVRTFSHLQVRNPINARSVARWRNYEKHLGPIIDVFGKAGISI